MFTGSRSEAKALVRTTTSAVPSGTPNRAAARPRDTTLRFGFSIKRKTFFAGRQNDRRDVAALLNSLKQAFHLPLNQDT